MLDNALTFLLLREERGVYCGGVNIPPDHPGGIALIQPKNKALPDSQ